MSESRMAAHVGLYVVWDPLGKGLELACTRDPAAKLEHAKREIRVATPFEVLAEAVEGACQNGESPDAQGL